MGANVWFVIQMRLKKNRTSHDYHGSVGSSGLNITLLDCLQSCEIQYETRPGVQRGFISRTLENPTREDVMS
jgi:hypothetical protein